jgi:hypothetical protein
MKLTKTEQKQVLTLQDEINNLPDKIENEEQLYYVSSVILKVRKTYNKYDDKRESYIAGAKQTIKNVNADFKQALEPLSVIEKTAAELIKEYSQNKIKQLNAIQEQAREDSGDMSLVIPLKIEKVASEDGEVRFKKSITVKIDDPKKVPRKYMTPDEKRIKKAIEAGETITGVSVVEGMSPSLHVNEK